MDSKCDQHNLILNKKYAAVVHIMLDSLQIFKIDVSPAKFIHYTPWIYGIIL